VQNYLELLGTDKRLPVSLIDSHPPPTHTVVYTRELVSSAVHQDLMAAEMKVPTPARKAKKEGGLAKLVRLVLGRVLNKDEQISHWGRRPLRPSQKLYAALVRTPLPHSPNISAFADPPADALPSLRQDAYCEVLIYDELRKIPDFEIDPITIDVE
jgi:hypothetical protein